MCRCKTALAPSPAAGLTLGATPSDSFSLNQTPPPCGCKNALRPSPEARCALSEAPSTRGFKKALGTSPAAGFSLVETVIALGLTAVIVAGASSLLRGYGKAAKAHEAEASAVGEIRLLTEKLRKYWLMRTRPAAGFSLGQPGFALYTGSGQPCTTNCPLLVINVTRPAGADVAFFFSQCVDPGAVPGLARLQTLDFAAAAANSCAPCPRGRIPAVTFASQLVPSEMQRFPHNGATSPSLYRLNDVLGVSACFDQNALGPLNLDVRAFTLGVGGIDAPTLALKTYDRSMTLPFDNFGGVRIDN